MEGKGAHLQKQTLKGSLERLKSRGLNTKETK